ncbi:MAG: hypothetical protein AAGC72_08435 [Planctomycetota bacterium]
MPMIPVSGPGWDPTPAMLPEAACTASFHIAFAKPRLHLQRLEPTGRLTRWFELVRRKRLGRSLFDFAFNRRSGAKAPSF